MGLDLGRVQGAGWFHTSAASSTSINVSSLQPQLTPFVGDAVLFPNGDVRQIIGVSGSTVTLGNVLWSNKGDPGIGNATLSNVDGDSTTDGFTQAAVKGAAQAKNYYNLGAYDTFVSNGDDTGMVPRNTRIVILNGSEVWAIYDGIPRSTAIDAFAKNSVDNLPNNSPYILFSGAGTYKLGVRVAPNSFTEEQWIEYLKSNPIIVQVKTAEKYQYTEKVIENHPIHIANQEECLYWHEEWRKRLNLFNYRAVQSAVSTDKLALSEGKIVANWKGAPFDYVIPFKTRGRATITVDFQSGGGYWAYNMVWLYSDGTRENLTQNQGINTPGVYTFTSSKGSVIGITCNVNLEYTISNIMINEGTHPYSNEDYNGPILHEKDLSGIQLFPADVNPAQTIGGDWEDKGTVTTSDNTVFHAYKRL